MIKKPIIIFGSGRCGSTIFHKVLSHHKDLAWMTRFCEDYTDKLYLNKLLMNFLNFPVLGGILRKRISPHEAYNLWEKVFPGFRNPCRDLNENDLNNYISKKILKNFNDMIPKNKRLLIKITGWPRYLFLKSLFPDAYFIHFVRDGRAVANSLVNTKFWRGWQGPQSWRFGLLEKKYQTEWEKFEKSFIVLAGISWKILMDSITKTVDSNVLTIKYEDFCETTDEVMKKVCEFCELSYYEKLKKKIENTEIKNTNYKYKEQLSRKQISDLESVVSSHLELFGYE